MYTFCDPPLPTTLFEEMEDSSHIGAKVFPSK